MQEMRCLPQIMQNLCIQGQTLSAHKLIIVLKSSLTNTSSLTEDMQEMLNTTINICNTQLLQHVITARYIDTNLLYNLLLAYDGETALKYLRKTLQMYKEDIPKIHTLACISLRILNFHKKYKDKVYLQDVIVTCKWWKRFKIKSSNINGIEFLKMSPEQRLKKLIAMNCLDVESLQEFCVDFNLELQKCYLIFLGITLKNWKPDFTVECGIGGKRIVIVKSNEMEIYKKCKPVADYIQDKGMLYEVIDNLWNQVGN